MNVTSVRRTNPKIGFPKLMISRNEGMIVLFSSEKQGVALDVGGSTYYKKGHFASDWIIDSFEDFHGTITLEQ